MKDAIQSIDTLILSPLRTYFLEKNLDRNDYKARSPFRSEILSMDQMVKLAQHLAGEHRITYEDSKEQLLKRLRDNEELLTHVTTLLKESVNRKNPITPAGEWLLDNYYLIEEQIQLGKRYLPKGYSKGLPKLSTGDMAGYPRVYDIIIHIISHSDGHVDVHTLNNFIRAYQEITELTLGELWAVPIMLRLGLLENLRRVATRIALDRMDADLANHWADKIIEVSEKEPANMILTLADMARSKPPLESTFVSEFNRRLQWKGSTHALPVSWLEQRLAENNSSINTLVLEENQKEAANQVSISNSINSLRFLAKLDWREFVESISKVEETLREDLNGVYAHMDFYSRDNYRHQIEKIAKQSEHSEHAVARMAVDLAHENGRSEKQDKRFSHVGYFLIGPGREQLERLVRVKRSPQAALVNFLNKFKAPLYFLGVFLLTVSVTYALIRAGAITWEQPVMLSVMTLLVMLASSQLAAAIVNWITSLSVTPTPLPRLDFSKGIPGQARTLVVVPTLITNKQQTEKILEDLEVRYLANKDTNLLFGLLTDLADATERIVPTDQLLEDTVTKGIIELNEKYCAPGQEQFFLFHRPRQWNEREKIWMGHERKRGKLEELNQLLRGKGRDRFSIVIGSSAMLTSVKYVITLDTDTQLPRESGWKLAGLMEHPLNQPQFNAARTRVIEGYGIIQPRIAMSLHGATRSLFSKMYENDAGIDPYTRIVSDAYQDVFREGSFIGKGIYHIDAFETVLHDRFPDNRILSHDLLEGSYVRCGFASDVQLYEEYPSRYSVDINRRHRWIRGDWQIANWFLPFVPGKASKFERNPIGGVSRWKIFDNLRRSVVPIVLLSILLLGWTLWQEPLLWTIAVAIMVMLPPVLNYGWNILHKPSEIKWGQHIRNIFNDTSRSLVQSLFFLICLPYEAFVSLDAILRSLWRMYVSKRNLLQWNPSNLVQRSRESLGNLYSRMWLNVGVSLVAGTYLVLNDVLAFYTALPFLLGWTFAPALVWRISQPIPSFRKVITEKQRLYLRELARKTWAFFESLVREEDNWLPPDNLQQYPIPVVAHRTSPTNIGMSLLANLAAYDFGYISPLQVIHRTHTTFLTLDKMERFAGHFYNWYDTRTLQVLNPRYISTVDSGNLAGHLLTLRQGLIMLGDEKFVPSSFQEGLRDTVQVLNKLLSREDQQIFHEFCEAVAREQNMSHASLRAIQEYLNSIAEQFKTIVPKLTVPVDSDAAYWVASFENQLRHLQEEISLVVIWTDFRELAKVNQGKVIPEIPSLRELASFSKYIQESRNQFMEARNASGLQWLEENEHAVKDISNGAAERLLMLERLIEKCREFADIEYEFLYDRGHHLLSIGYTVDNHHRDASFYDLLASEARLSSFVAIAQGKLPQENWFALGRRLTSAGDTPTLLSWSGSMFEYLMPLLVMPTYEGTLLDETYTGNIAKQVQYGRQQDIPWGISESCYNVVDAHLTYQYKAFGVPDLGFKRGLDKDLVIAPYASVMALMVDPAVAVENLQRLSTLGYEGRLGFFEAIDYTPTRLPRTKAPVLIQTFMAHHEGMSLLSLDYVLNGQPMQKRFSADPEFQTALLLLQERVPKTTAYYKGSSDSEETVHITVEGETRIITQLNTPVPEIQLLSNGKYHVMVTHAGGGYSRWKDLSITRWREDSTRDHWGAFCYIRNLETGDLWSTTYQPTLKKPDQYEAIFSQGRAEFRRKDYQLECHTEIVVSPEDDIEIRRIRLYNQGSTDKVLEVTSYAEVVMATPIADASHPAFSNLFVQTEILADKHAVLCTRRARSKDEVPPHMFQLMKLSHQPSTAVSFETDRMKFMGRGRSIACPLAMDSPEPLHGSQGPVLDPMIAIQYRFTIPAGERVTIDWISGMAETREGVSMLVDKYQDNYLRDRAFDLSWTHSQVILRQLNATESQAQLYAKLASSVVYNNPMLRAAPDILLKNVRGQSALWSYSISGDLPIVLVRISESESMALARQLIQARAYWQLKGLSADLVILHEDTSVYRQELLEQIQQLILGAQAQTISQREGGVFVRATDQIAPEDYILLHSVAKVVLADSRGTLEDQIIGKSSTKTLIPATVAVKPYKPQIHRAALPQNLTVATPLGGFTEDGREYVILTGKEQHTPLPWVNVIANKEFGTIVSESGPSYTWFENAQLFRLTPWSNDAVTDQAGEAYYIRDNENGHCWSPTPWPVKSASSYITRHGFGYTVYEHQHDQLSTQTKIFVDSKDPIRFTSIRIKNNSDRKRKLSLAGYIEWVLGSLRQQSVMHVITERDASTGAIFVRNPYNGDFPNRTAFIFIDEPGSTYTCDRREFIGRNGTLQLPAGMNLLELSGKSGAGLDPCTAYMVPIELQPGQEREIIFRIGAARDRDNARAIVSEFKGIERIHKAFQSVTEFWEHTLGAVQVATPDTAINILANGWLLYQVLSCRFWGRSGFYQSGGAYGYRDQLQDSLALLHASPSLTREHIITSATRQFIDGDVQHWWHPPVNRGVRTLCSDDFLWLPYVTSAYVLTTGDETVLKEMGSFIDGRQLQPHEESYYDLPSTSAQRANVYEHCKRAIQRGMERMGIHGLPLMGAGDWNDGMNLVGIEGKGESIWLGFFLYEVLNKFIPIAMQENDKDFISEMKQAAENLKKNLNKNGWSGEWYIRAYFDNGDILGSPDNDECKIDSISQSWSVISRAGETDRSKLAMASVDRYLVNREKSIIQLLDPPFNTSALSPGYIKGYLPGVRENGGQYTHAAIWTVMAFAELRDREKTWELLQLINPINHGRTMEDIKSYKVEPYVLAADVYGVEPHVGRGGWTWYTGSAGWMYQLILQSFLGIKREGDRLKIEPCTPMQWQDFAITYRYDRSVYKIQVQCASPDDGSQESTVPDEGIVLVDDGQEHTVSVVVRIEQNRTQKQPNTLKI